MNIGERKRQVDQQHAQMRAIVGNAEAQIKEAQAEAFRLEGEYRLLDELEREVAQPPAPLPPLELARVGVSAPQPEWRGPWADPNCPDPDPEPTIQDKFPEFFPSEAAPAPAQPPRTAVDAGRLSALRVLGTHKRDPLKED